MKLVTQVPIDPKPVDSFLSIFDAPMIEEICEQAAGLRARLNGRVIWNVNSTAAGGGVAEMLHTLLAYARGLGVDTQWLVIGGYPEFFRITKRLHNAFHGEVGDGSALDAAAAAVYERVTAENARELDMIRAGDIAILHDPQTAGLIPHLADRGVGVVWRCHIGNDAPSEEGDRAWNFLGGYLTQANAFIFSRFAYLPEVLYHGRCMVVAPSIDPFSPKNQDMDEATVRAILTHLGIVSGEAGRGSRVFTLSDGRSATVQHEADVLRAGEPPSWDTPLVVQVSRWDRLKDPTGVLQGFLRSTNSDGDHGAHLALAGPNVQAVSDDPEGLEVFEEVVAHWKALPQEQRERVHLITLPMNDLQENAAMVNALQRHAAIVVQKSLREGFGLTVTEAMWKAKPVIASAVGGIQDQIEHGVSGLLLRNPCCLDSFAGAIHQVLKNRGLGERLGSNAKQRVQKNYLGLKILAQYDDLLERIEHDPITAEVIAGNSFGARRAGR